MDNKFTQFTQKEGEWEKVEKIAKWCRPSGEIGIVKIDHFNYKIWWQLPTLSTFHVNILLCLSHDNWPNRIKQSRPWCGLSHSLYFSPPLSQKGQKKTVCSLQQTKNEKGNKVRKHPIISSFSWSLRKASTCDSGFFFSVITHDSELLLANQLLSFWIMMIHRYIKINKKQTKQAHSSNPNPQKHSNKCTKISLKQGQETKRKCWRQITENPVLHFKLENK